MNHVYNVAVCGRNTFNELFAQLQRNLLPVYPHLQGIQPVFCDFRSGDVRHSQSYIGKVQRLLSYLPSHHIDKGLIATVRWYLGSN